MSPFVHVNIQLSSSDADLRSLVLSVQQGVQMANDTLQEVRQILAGYKTTTDQIAAGLTEVSNDVAALLAKVTNPAADKLSDQEIADAQATQVRLQGLADALTKLGTDTNADATTTTTDPNAPGTSPAPQP